MYKKVRKMDYRQFIDTYVIRIDRGEEIISVLTDFCKKEKITLGSVEALGAADHVVIGLYDVAQHQYHKHTFPRLSRKLRPMTGSRSIRRRPLPVAVRTSESAP